MTKPNPDDYFGDSKGEAKPKGKRSLNPDDYFGPIEPPKPKAEKPPGLIKRGLAALANGRGVDEVDAGGGTAPVLQDGQESAAPVDDIGGGRGRVNPEPARADSRRGGTPTTLRSGAYMAGMEEAPTAPTAGELLETPRADFQPSQADLEWQSLSPTKQQEILARGAQRGSPGAFASEPGVAETIAANVREATSNPVARGAVAGFSQLGQTGVGAVRAVADAVGADGVADFAAGASGKATQIGTGATRDLKGNDKLVADISSSILNSAPALAVGVAGGPALRTLFAQSALAEYNSGRDAGFSPAESATRAGIMGLAESLGERFGLPQQIALLKSVAKHVPTGELAKTFGSMIAREIPGEQLTTAMQFLADKLGPAALKPNASLADYLSQAGETLKVTIGQTAVMGGGPAAIGAVRDTYAKSDRATATPEQILAQAIDQAAAQFGLNTKAAATLREKIAGMDPDAATNYAEKVFAAAERAGFVKKPGGGTAVRQNLKDLAEKAAKDAEAQQGDASGDSAPAGAAASSDTGLADELDAGAILGTQAEAPQATSGEAPTGDGTDAVATDQAQPGVEAGAAPPIEGEPINKAWSAFTPESGTLNIPREQMPQVDAEHRGALVQFLGARGITHESAEVPADSLKPTQAEFSPKKVEHFAGNPSGRSILVSQDGYVLDGHHQWMAKRAAGEPVKVIRLNAPIQDLLRLTHQFPSSTTSKGPRNVVSGNGAGPDSGRSAQPGPADAGDGRGTGALVPGELQQPGAAGTAGGAVPDAGPRDVPGADRPGDGNEALKPGQSVTVDGKPYTVKSAKPKVLVLTGADGKPRTITSDSATWAKVQPAGGRQADGRQAAGDRQLTSGPISEEFAGQMGEGMAEHVAKQQQKRLTKERPELEWTVAETDATRNPKLKADRYVVQGRAPVAQAKPDQERAPAGGVEPAGAAAAPAVPAAGSAEVEANGLIDPFKLDKATLNRELDKIVASDDAPDLIRAFTVLRRRYEKATGKKSIPPAGSRYAMLPDEPAAAPNTGKPPTKAKSKPPKEKPAKPVMGSWPLGYIVHSLGGIGMSLRSDLSRKEARTRTNRKTGKVTHYTDWRGNGLLFRERGSTDLTEMARVLEEAGYIEPGLVKRDYLEATSQVQDIIKAEINNPGSTEPTYSDDFEEMMRRQEEARRIDYEMESFSVDDMDQAGGGEYDAEQQAVFAQLAKEAEALGIDVDLLREQFYDEANPEWSQKEYDQALTEALKQAIARVAGQAPGNDASGARDGGQGSVEADPVAPGAGSDRADGPDQAVQAEGLTGKDLFGARPEDVGSAKQDLEAKRKALVDLEDRIVSLAGLAPGFVEDALRSRKVPKALKDERDQLREDIRQMREQVAKLDTPALTLTAESEADAQAKAKREADALAAEQKAKADEQARLKREANKREADARAAAILAEREAAKKAEVDAAAEDFALGQEPPKPVDKKVVAKDLAEQKDIFGGAAPFADPLTMTERQLNSLRGKPITMKAQTEDGQVASWEIDAAEAVQSLRSREATIQQLVRCLS